MQFRTAGKQTARSRLADLWRLVLDSERAPGPRPTGATQRVDRALWGRCHPIAFWLSMLLPILPLTGCQEPAPVLETHGVTGTIRFSNGDPVISGMIDFRSKRDQRLTMNGEILEDGSFELTTLHDNHNYKGAVEGPCSAVVTLFFPGNPIPLNLDLPETYDVKPGANQFHIKLKLPPPKKT